MWFDLKLCFQSSICQVRAYAVPIW
jgi:hypothetical protein